MGTTLISADNTWALMAITCGWVAFSIWAEQRFVWASKLSGAIIALIGALALTNFGIIPTHALWFDDIIWGYVVPLAIPLICGPGIIAILVTIRGSNPSATFLNCLAALVLAWLVQTVILLCGRQIARLLGSKTLDALESLMGLLLTCIAVGLLINGINETYGIQVK